MEDRLEELAVVGFDFDETVGFDDVREGFLHLAFNLAGEVAELVFLAEVDVVNGDVPFSGNVLGIAAADLDVGVVGGRVEFFRRELQFAFIETPQGNTCFVELTAVPTAERLFGAVLRSARCWNSQLSTFLLLWFK